MANLTAEQLDLYKYFQEFTPNYTSYTFEEIVVELINRLRAKNTAWNDVYTSSTGQMLIEFHAYVAQLVLYYLERRAHECYLPTARNRSSVVNLVKLINYTPKRKTSSVGQLTFSIPTARGKIIHIPVYTEVQDDNGTKFIVGYKETTSANNIYNYTCSCGSVIPRPYAPTDQLTYTGKILGGGYIGSNGTSVVVDAVQGELVQKEITSNGAANQVYFINHLDVENDTLSIRVDNNYWTQVTSFVPYDYTGEVFRVLEQKDGRLKIYFGDGVKGKIPPANSVINLTYVRTKGIDSNIFSTGQITTINDVILDEDSQIVTNISVTNSSKFQGGDDAEDIEEIRTEAPKVFAMGDRAVTKYDFKALLQNYAGIATVNVWGENEENPPNYDMFNLVKICMLLQNWESPSSAFKTTITNYIKDYSMLTVKYEFVDAVILYILPEVEVKCESNYTTAQAQTAIETALDTLIGDTSLGTTNHIGADLYYSDVMKVLAGLSSVDYIHLWLHLYEDLTDSLDTTGDYVATLTYGSAEENTVKIYIDNTLVGYDDGNGNIIDASTSSSDSYTVSGTINYTTGALSVNISTSLPSGSEIHCRYRATENGDVGAGNYQICRIVKDTNGDNWIDMSFIAT
jgi:hypothetical protein